MTFLLSDRSPIPNKPDLEAPSTSAGILPASGDQILLVSCDQPETQPKKKVKTFCKVTKHRIDRDTESIQIHRMYGSGEAQDQ